MIPGRTTRLRLRADRPGIFRGQCAEYCGGAHALMAIEVVAMPAGEFDGVAELRSGAGGGTGNRCRPARQVAFPRRRLRRLPRRPRHAGAPGRSGRTSPISAARRSVGASTLPMTQANLARFVADGQHVKPGNKMPPFRIFSAPELDELAGYLLSLR